MKTTRGRIVVLFTLLAVLTAGVAAGGPEGGKVSSQLTALYDEHAAHQAASRTTAFTSRDRLARVVAGDRVVVRATVHGVHKGPFMGTPPTGKAVAFPLIIIYRLADGKIIEHWMLTDMLAFMEQIGVGATVA